MKTLKAYYKAKYGCEAKSDKKPCTAKSKAAKAEMKKAHTVLTEFKSNLKTAHHHGKKLRKRLKQALKKLHFVFKEARGEVRKSLQEFHAGYDVHYSALQTISMTAIKKAKAEKASTATTDKVVKTLVKQAAKAIAK